MEELHNKNIIFRDLKPENVLIGKDGHCLLIDFGLSKEGIQSHITGAQSFCGSVAYLAPELLQRKEHGKAVDWYLLGLLIYEMLSGMPPFYSNQKEQLFYNIQHAELNLPSNWSPEIQSLITQLMN